MYIGHLQNSVKSSGIRSLAEDELLALESLDPMDGTARHEHRRIASLHLGRLPILGDLDPTLDDAEILLVVLQKLHAESAFIVHVRSSAAAYSPCADVEAPQGPLHRYRLCP